MRSMYGYFVRNVFVKYMEGWDKIIWRFNVVKATAGVVFCAMTLATLLSKKWGIAWEVEKEMEMCLWAAKWWYFRIMECGKDG